MIGQQREVDSNWLLIQIMQSIITAQLAVHSINKYCTWFVVGEYDIGELIHLRVYGMYSAVQNI